jgi:hypothetical protein
LVVPALQTTRAACLALLLIGGASLSACAAIWGFEDSLPDASTDAAADVTTRDTGREGGPGVDGGHDGSNDGTVHDGAPEADAAAPDADAIAPPDVDPCITTTAETGFAFYVSIAKGADSAGCGTMGSPCASISQALFNTTTTSGITVVNVDEGAYSESLTLMPGIAIVGGWRYTPPTWVKDMDTPPPPSARLVVQPISSSKTVVASSMGGTATLCTMTLESMADAGPGETLYGVFATGNPSTTTIVNLIDVTILVSGGGNGTTGTNGGMGNAGTASGCTPADAGSMETPVGDAGDPADTGTFSSSGYVPAGGGTGGMGEPGTNGTAAPAAPCITCVAACTLGCGIKTSSMGCGGLGVPGCPGQGGKPGAGGGGGGSSVGIFVFDATVTITGSTITVSNGGNGAPGGLGGDGGAGAPGVSGATGSSCSTACGGVPCEPETSEAPDGGAPGGLGGSGSSGGPGGGGAGGFSCPIALGGGGNAPLDASAFTQGTGGTGAGGAPSGGNGGDAGICLF